MTSMKNIPSTDGTPSREEMLKPCPFCGSSDIDPEGVLANREGGENYSYPACNDCSASCENWNLRADTPAPVSDAGRDKYDPLAEFERVLMSAERYGQCTFNPEAIAAIRHSLSTPSRVEAPDAKEALEDFNKWCGACNASTIQTIRRALTAQQSVAGLVEALRFYATRENYDDHTDGEGDIYEYAAVTNDNGKRAQQALREWERKDE